LHLPLVAGVVFFALGVHEAVADAAEPLALLSAVAVAGGVAMFFVGDVAYRWRDHHQLAADRLLAAVGSAALIPVATFAPALAALAGLTVVCLLQTGWELWRHPEIGPVGPADWS
jgi:low temperature requirement protein LtrA